MGIRRSLCDTHSGRPRRDRREDRDVTQSRRASRRGAVERPVTERRVGVAVPLVERGQARPRARPVETGRARCRARPRALGRRGDRVVLPQGDARVGPRLRRVARGEPGPRHAVELSDGPDRADAPLCRIRHDGGGGRRVLSRGRMARPATMRAVHGLHRLHLAALRCRGAARRARMAATDRRGTVHRLLTDGGVPALART